MVELSPTPEDAAALMTAEESHPSVLLAWWTLLVLFLAYVLSFIDRTIISLLVAPIEHDLQITDTQLSLLQGLAFSLFYTIGGLPIAIVADRKSRRAIASAGIAVWSLATVACGLVANYAQLFIARIGVGVGEATLGPCSYSLIADTFPEAQRGRAMGIYGGAVMMGAGGALMIGSAVIAFIGGTASVDTWFGPIRSWQMVFMVVGFPGLVIAMLALTIAEPRRQTRGSAEPSPPLWPFIRANRWTVASLFLGLAFLGTMAAALMAWAPAFYARVHHVSSAEIGTWLGPIFAICGLAGNYCGGVWSDRWSRRGISDATLRTARLSGVGAMIFGPIAMLASNLWVSLALVGLAIFTGGGAYPTGAAALQKLAPPRLRARLSALYLFVVGLVSGVLAPTGVALTTDYFFHDQAKIGWSLAIVIFTSGCVTLVILSSGLASYRKSISHGTATTPR